jgi:hypothetical protein
MHGKRVANRTSLMERNCSGVFEKLQLQAARLQTQIEDALTAEEKRTGEAKLKPRTIRTAAPCPGPEVNQPVRMWTCSLMQTKMTEKPRSSDPTRIDPTGQVDAAMQPSRLDLIIRLGFIALCGAVVYRAVPDGPPMPVNGEKAQAILSSR